MTDLDAIYKRDSTSGAAWFTGPASFTAQAARDRRTLLIALEAQGKVIAGLKADIKFLCSGVAHHVDDVAEIERLRGLLREARDSLRWETYQAGRDNIALRIDAALGTAEQAGA